VSSWFIPDNLECGGAVVEKESIDTMERIVRGDSRLPFLAGSKNEVDTDQVVFSF